MNDGRGELELFGSDSMRWKDLRQNEQPSVIEDSNEIIGEGLELDLVWFFDFEELIPCKQYFWYASNKSFIILEGTIEFVVNLLSFVDNLLESSSPDSVRSIIESNNLELSSNGCGVVVVVVVVVDDDDDGIGSKYSEAEIHLSQRFNILWYWIIPTLLSKDRSSSFSTFKNKIFPRRKLEKSSFFDIIEFIYEIYKRCSKDETIKVINK